MKTLNHKYNDIISLRWSHNYNKVSRERILTGLNEMKSNLKIIEAARLPAIEEDIQTVSSGAAFSIRIDHRIPGNHHEYVPDYARCVYEEGQQDAKPRVYYTYD